MILDLSLLQIIVYSGLGAVLAVLYLYLLWKTICLLPRIKRKGLFLLASVVIRITLLISLALIFSQNHAGKFLWIIIGFILTRLILVGCFRKGIKGHLNG